MAGNTFGNILTMTSFGESHGSAIGVIIDGMPSMKELNIDNLQVMLDKRRPGRMKGTSARKEKDIPEILSGIFDNKTLGTPICVIVRNKDARSSDYEHLKDEVRPGHADKSVMSKYGIRDYRGGGRMSGRETIARVIGGYFASLIIPKVKIKTSITSIGDLTNPDEKILYEYLQEIGKKQDSVGARLSLEIRNCPINLGMPVFDKFKADLAKSILSIGGCVSFSYGVGDEIADKKGSEICKDNRYFSGIEGGISTGENIVINTTFRPISSIGKWAQKGRHDPCIVPRVIPVVESMILFVIADHFLLQNAYNKNYEF